MWTALTDPALVANTPDDQAPIAKVLKALQSHPHVRLLYGLWSYTGFHISKTSDHEALVKMDSEQQGLQLVASIEIDQTRSDREQLLIGQRDAGSSWGMWKEHGYWVRVGRWSYCSVDQAIDLVGWIIKQEFRDAVLKEPAPAARLQKRRGEGRKSATGKKPPRKARLDFNDYLQLGDYARAIPILEKLRQTDVVQYTLACAYLGAEKYKQAMELFPGLIDRDDPRSDYLYIEAGIAAWGLGKYADAVDYWVAGQNCGYREASGGVQIALLQYFAGIRLHDQSITDAATLLLQKRLKAGWASNWPGSVGRYVVGEYTEEDMRLEGLYPLQHDIHLWECRCQLEFHIGVVKLRSGDVQGYRQQLRLCAPPHLAFHCPESYLARMELRRRITAKP